MMMMMIIIIIVIVIAIIIIIIIIVMSHESRVMILIKNTITIVMRCHECALAVDHGASLYPIAAFELAAK